MKEYRNNISNFESILRASLSVGGNGRFISQFYTKSFKLRRQRASVYTIVNSIMSRTAPAMTSLNIASCASILAQIIAHQLRDVMAPNLRELNI